ncbi:hypothetical protein [Streptomyces sp. NPDC047315]|uniref:hypothetical protein n=1 Tax=Streptomyces sp. NPDC047315 TaxID=3155142 RepID=UPI0033D155E7
MPLVPAIPLSSMYALAVHGPFVARVRIASTCVARQVLMEDPSTPGHPLRASLARSVLNPADLTASASAGLTPVIATADTIVTAAAGAVSQQPEALNAAVTDAQILTAVRDAWNITAGVPRDLLPPPI